MERMSDDLLLNCKDAAALLGISPRTLERYAAEAQIPYIRLPQRGERAPIRFSRSHLRKWLDQHTVKPSPLSRFRGNTHAGEVREDGSGVVAVDMPQPTALDAAVQVIVWPVALGTALVILAFLPMPPTFMKDWIASSLFWVFAAVGVAVAQKLASAAKAPVLRLQTVDLVAAGVLLLMGVLARGINLAP
jgi:hypothetical protein